MHPEDIWQSLEAFSVLQMLLSVEQRPGMLLSILSACYNHTQQRIVWPQMSMLPTLRNSTVTITWITTHSDRKILNLVSPVSEPSCQHLLLLLVPYDVADVENWSNTSSVCPYLALALCSRIGFPLTNSAHHWKHPCPCGFVNSYLSTANGSQFRPLPPIRNVLR